MRDLNRLLIIVLTFAIVGALLFLSDKSYFQLNTISINQFDNSARDWLFDDIKKKVRTDTKAYVGKYMWEIDLKDLMTHVELDKRVNKVQVKRKFPNKIEVKILPHEPIAMYFSRKEGVLPIARDGNFMPKLNRGDFLDTPIMRGVAFYKDIKLRKKAIELILNLENNNYLNSQKVSEVLYDSKQGYSLILSPEGEILRMGKDNFSKRV